MLSESLDCRSNAAQMQLERFDQNASFNASRLPPESISIFLVLKESNSNALRMPSKSIDCRSNAA